MNIITVWSVSAMCDRVSFALYQRHLFHNTSSMGIVFDAMIDRGVVCIRVCLTGGWSVSLRACVYMHTHTNCTRGTQMWAEGSARDTWRARRIQMDQISGYIFLYPHMCAKYTCVYVCWAAGSDLENLFLSTYFSFRKEKQKMQMPLWWHWELESTWIWAT